MATECYTQLGFGFQPKLVVDFAGGTLTTDAGLLLVRQFDEQLGLSADVVGRNHRHARRALHHARPGRARPPAVVSDRGGVQGRPAWRTAPCPVTSAFRREHQVGLFADRTRPGGTLSADTGHAVNFPTPVDVQQGVCSFLLIINRSRSI